MRRRLFAVLCTTLTVLALLTAAMWVHGLFQFAGINARRVDRDELGHTFSIRNLEWSGGRVILYADTGRLHNPDAYSKLIAEPSGHWTVDYYTAPPGFDFRQLGPSLAGVQYRDEARASADIASRVITLVLPCWLLLPAAAALPAWAFVRRRRTRARARAGLCRACGYDLRSSTDRCPECGADIAGDVAPHPAALRSGSGTV